MPKIFITHAWDDIVCARKIYDDLKARNYELWFDDKTLQPGHRLAEEINRGLAWCDFYIPVISSKALDSPWCWEEINAALNLSNQRYRDGRPNIVPIIIEACEQKLNESYPSLGGRLYVVFYGRDYEQSFKELVSRGLVFRKPSGQRIESPQRSQTISMIPSWTIGIGLAVFLVCLLGLGSIAIINNFISFVANPTNTLTSLVIPSVTKIVFIPTTPRPPTFIFTPTFTSIPPTGTPTLVPTLGPVARDKIAFTTNRDAPYQEIYLMNTDGANQQRLTFSNNAKGFPVNGGTAFSPDGRLIAFGSMRDGPEKIFLMNADGTNQRALTNSVSDSVPAWSPDGKYIVFTSKPGVNQEIYRMSAVDGSELVRLTNTPGRNNRQPTWSRDNKIAFQSDRDGNWNIYIMNALDGSGLKQLTNDLADDEAPNWSPDGQSIVFSSKRFGIQEIMVMNADGSNQRRLIGLPPGDLPEWSRDGRLIAFHSGVMNANPSAFDIYIMNADGTNLKRLTYSDGKVINAKPSWSP